MTANGKREGESQEKFGAVLHKMCYPLWVSYLTPVNGLHKHTVLGSVTPSRWRMCIQGCLNSGEIRNCQTGPRSPEVYLLLQLRTEQFGIEKILISNILK